MKVWENDFAIMECESVGEGNSRKSYNLRVKEGVLLFLERDWEQKAKFECSACVQNMQVSIPSSLKTIGANAFFGIASIRRLEIPDNVEIIGVFAFSKCDGLEEVTINAKYIERNAFCICRDLRSVEISKSVAKIGSSAFADCHSLEDISLTSGLTEIGLYAFGGCNRLTRIEIPETVKLLVKDVFYFCTALEEIIVPKHLLEKYGEEYIKSGTRARVTTVVPYGGEITKQEAPDLVEEYELGLETEVDSGNQRYGGKKCNVKTSERDVTIPKRSYNGVIRTNLICKKKKK